MGCILLLSKRRDILKPLKGFLEISVVRRFYESDAKSADLGKECCFCLKDNPYQMFAALVVHSAKGKETKIAFQT